MTFVVTLFFRALLVNKKGEVHHHLINFILSFLAGALFMYFIAQGMIPIHIAVCPTP